MAGPWTLTVRERGRVSRQRFDELEEALDALDVRVAEAERAPARAPVDLRVRQFAPEAQIAVRAEVSGPGRLLPAVRAGVDVRGDGSTLAWRGRVRREPIEAPAGAAAGEALRQALRE
jgi:hypothetical protein